MRLRRLPRRRRHRRPNTKLLQRAAHNTAAGRGLAIASPQHQQGHLNLHQAAIALCLPSRLGLGTQDEILAGRASKAAQRAGRRLRRQLRRTPLSLRGLLGQFVEGNS